MSQQGLIAATFSVRPATEIERRKLTGILFPRSETATAELIVASLNDEPPIGGAAIWFRPNRVFPEHAEFALHVREPHRRNGIGRDLLDRLINTARGVGAKEMRSPLLKENSAGFKFAIACGFQPKPPTISYEAPMADYIRAFAPVYERLVSRGKIPSGARIIPLKEANREEVCRLIMDNLGFPSEDVADRLRGTEQGYSQTISRVALLDGKMVGATLMTYQKAAASVVGTAVIPQHRNSWINAALKYHVMQELIGRDVQWVRFSASETQHRDTANFARRIGARVLSKVSRTVLDLNWKQ